MLPIPFVGLLFSRMGYKMISGILDVLLRFSVFLVVIFPQNFFPVIFILQVFLACLEKLQSQ